MILISIKYETVFKNISLMADNMAASNARICGYLDKCVFESEIEVEKTSYEKIVILVSIRYEGVYIL